MIRWKKRLGGWAMFRGTSRKASAWVRVTKRKRVITAHINEFKCWLYPKTVAQAKAWCERALPYGYDHVIEADFSLVIMPDGTVKYQAVENRDSLLMYTFPPRSMQLGVPQEKLAVEEVVLRGRKFAAEASDPASGMYIRWYLVAYSLPQHEHIADELAKVHLEEQRRKHFLRLNREAPYVMTTPGICL